MLSLRYVTLAIIYICEYYYITKNLDHYQDQVLLLLLVLTTFIFIFVIKYIENEKCKSNKLLPKYLISQSIFYSIIAVISQYIYKLLLDQECVSVINTIFKYSYIPEAFFIAGFVLLLNQLSNTIYPKCEVN